MHEVAALSNGDHLHNAITLSYLDLYDGVLVVNPITLFAVRLCAAELVYLTPVLRQRLSLPLFLALHSVRSGLSDASRVHMDRAS